MQKTSEVLLQASPLSAEGLPSAGNVPDSKNSFGDVHGALEKKRPSSPNSAGLSLRCHELLVFRWIRINKVSPRIQA
jgi:hypothetical protein